MGLSVVILAAGQGKRMRSARPKVLQSLGGRPLLSHCLASARCLDPDGCVVVVGHGADQVRAAFPDESLHWVHQEQQLGTGHAVASALPDIEDGQTVLVLYGDVPLVRPETQSRLAEIAAQDRLAILTTKVDNPRGYGRILRNADGGVERIVEERDADEQTRAIREINTGLLAAPARRLRTWLADIDNDNAQGEYYLTDVIALAAGEGLPVEAVVCDDPGETSGVNDRRQLAAAEAELRHRRTHELLDAGVTLIDPTRVDVRGNVTAGEDVMIDVNVVLEGDIHLEEGVQIGPGSVLRDVRLGAGTRVDAHCVLESVRTGRDCRIGPFARLRPDTELGDAARVGNFVETKKARIGPGSKVNHLSYVGDADLGREVNVGAGTITCNYDGANKHHTDIGDGAFVGSGTQLVAPVRIGAEATIGAGSTISKDAPDGELTLTRVKQQTVRGWKRPAKKKP